MKKIQSINPFNGNLLYKTDFLSETELNYKLSIAWQTYISQRGESIQARIANLLTLNDILKKNRSALANTITSEMGKPIAESLLEIDKCARLCLYYSKHAHELIKPYLIDNEELTSKVVCEPLGVILGIMPWNFPFWQVFRFALPSILVGNTVLLKHAPNVPLCGLKLEELFQKAGFSEGTYQNIFASDAQVELLLEDHRIKGVSITGSEKAGRIVAGIAGRNLKKQVLELGGSDPFIVMPTANINEAIKWAIKSRLINAGQSCIAAKRFIIHEAIYDQFLSGLKKELAKLTIGDPMATGVDIGPMARQDLADTLNRQVAECIEMGAIVESKFSIKDEHTMFAPIHVLSNIKKGMPAYQDELFGPVFSLFKVATLDDAIELANNTTFGLGASLWTSDEYEKKQGEQRIAAGCVFINAMVRSDASLPFGGINNSGYGRELAGEGLREFCNIKTIVRANS